MIDDLLDEDRAKEMAKKVVLRQIYFWSLLVITAALGAGVEIGFGMFIMIIIVFYINFPMDKVIYWVDYSGQSPNEVLEIHTVDFWKRTKIEPIRKATILNYEWNGWLPFLKTLKLKQVKGETAYQVSTKGLIGELGNLLQE
jgi:hypothetical protein